MRNARPCFALVIFLLGLFKQADAQQWQPVNPPLNPFNGTIYTTEVDASGTIYAGGEFKNSAQKYTVVKWDGNLWSEVGNGTSALNATNRVYALATHGDTVYAAGAFTNSFGKNYVAKWNGTTWNELGLGSASLNANSSIFSVAIDKTGNIYAAGAFTNASGKYYVARWNGTAWTELGAGTNALNANDAIFHVATDAAGNVYAGGYFTNSSGKQYVAKWNGATWSEVGTGANALNATDFIGHIAADNSGNLYAAGAFRNSNSQPYLAKWNGSTWSEVRSGSNALNANDNINAIAVKNENEIYVAGIFTHGGGSYYVAKWNGSTWSEVNNAQKPLWPNNHVESITLGANNSIYIGGKFTNKSGHSYVAQWDGTVWSETGGTADPFYSSQPIYQVISDSLNRVFVSGYFLDNDNTRYLQYWNGKTWQRLKPQAPGVFLYIDGENQMVMDRKGNLYVAGHKAGLDKRYDCILKWDGLQWSILESFPNELAVYPDIQGYGIGQIKIDGQDNLYVSGSFNDAVYGLNSFAKWDGKTWSRLPGSSADYIQNFCVGRNGNIYAYGGFTNEIGHNVVANYNPVTRIWSELKSQTTRLSVPGYNVFMDIKLDSNNNVYVNGLFTNTAGKRYVAKWDGVNWTELGTTDHLGPKLAIDDKNNIYVNVETNWASDYPVKKWNGTSWLNMGSLLTNGVALNGSLLATDAAGIVYTDAPSNEPGVGSYIVRYSATVVLPPQLTAFSPNSGSKGTTVTIKGRNLGKTVNISFGGTKASSFTVENDSTVKAVVGGGSTGSVVLETTGGIDSLKTFTYTCDSITGPIPTITLFQDSILLSSAANHYQWFFNNQQLDNETGNRVRIKGAGFYQVKTSTDKVCWIPSLHYPVLVNQNALPDSLRVLVYPNPSNGQFTVYVRTPQVGSMKVQVQVSGMNGVLVAQTNKIIFYGNEIRIPITLTSKGTFIVKIIVNDKTSQQTILIL
jgi:hypothetical protein